MVNNFINPWDQEYGGETEEAIYEPLWEMVSDQLPATPAKAIDFGCGDGKYSFLLRKLGFEVIGVDSSVKAIQLATKIREKQKIIGVDFAVDCVVPGFIRNSSVDVVIALNSYHCLSRSERALFLDTVLRVLTPKGVLILSVLSRDDESYPRREWIEVESNEYKDKSGKLFHFFSEEEIVTELGFLKLINIEILENIHPEIGRKSSLYVAVFKKV